MHLWREGRVDAFQPSWPGLTRPSRARTPAVARAPWMAASRAAMTLGVGIEQLWTEGRVAPSPHCKGNGERGLVGTDRRRWGRKRAANPGMVGVNTRRRVGR